MMAILVVLFLLIGPLDSFAHDFIPGDCDTEHQKICPDLSLAPAGEVFRCLEKNSSLFSAACQKGIEQRGKNFKALQLACREDFLRLCQINLDTLLVKNLGGEAVLNCAVKNWGALKSECKEVLKESDPGFKEIESSLQKNWEQEKKKLNKRIKIRGLNVTVMADFQSGDVIWYKARLVDKKEKSRYPFCPPAKEKGLQVIENFNAGSCSYEISAAWKDDLVRKLKEAGQFDNIDQWGLRCTACDLKFDKAAVEKIVAPFNARCPAGFEIDVRRNPKRQYVSCEKKDGFTCREGFYRTEKYFGCVELWSCSQTNSRYAEIGEIFQCGFCYAGGCLDHVKSSQEGFPYCQVDYKNSAKTPGCSPG